MVADFPNEIIDFGSLCLVRTIGHQTAIDVCILHLGKHFLVPFDGLRPTGQQTDEGGLGGCGLYDPTAWAVRFGVQELVGQADHLAQPIHHDSFQFRTGWTGSLVRTQIME